MRVVIDLQGAQTTSRLRGIGRYSVELAKGILRNRGNHEIIIVLNNFTPEIVDTIYEKFRGLLPKEDILIWSAASPVFEMLPENRSRLKVAELLREAFIASLKADVILICSLFEGWAEDFTISVKTLDKETPVAVVLYDLIPLMNSEKYLADPEVNRWYKAKISHCKKADLLLSISESAACEAVEHLNFPAASVINISTAVGGEFRVVDIAPSDQNSLRQNYGLSQEFLMYSGAADERKNHKRLISAYASLSKEIRADHQLVFVGDLLDSQRSHFERHAARCGLGVGELMICGRVTDDELIALYNLCKAFVFPSWHEGFGLPALEAMACGRAVICSSTSSLPEVVGRDDALFDPFDEADMTQKIAQVLTDEAFRVDLEKHCLKYSENFSWDKTALIAIRSMESLASTKKGVAKSAGIIKKQLISMLAAMIRSEKLENSEIPQIAQCFDNNDQIRLKRCGSMRDLEWRFEGPFDSSYSLALLNRETALAMDSLGYKVALHSTEGPGDFEPSEEYLNNNHKISHLYKKSRVEITSQADIISRNLYPPRVDDIEGGVGFLHHYAWEEGGFPQEWAQSFNENLDGMTCLSEHVRKVMIDNGVYIPMTVSGCGVDHWDRIDDSASVELEAKGFKFLHVSSCFPRKGVQTLLEAYGEAFSSEDDVSLIIKTFANPHNDVHDWLKREREGNSLYPHVVIIEKEFLDQELKALYKMCDVLVAPSKAEGFGLPLAEALLSGLPVITTAWSGQLDFCDNKNSWLIDYRFEKAETHFGLFSSAWAKPSLSALTEAMREAGASSPEYLASKAKFGRDKLLEKFKWVDVVSRYVEAVKKAISFAPPKESRIAWVSTWNEKCGIAMYSEHLISNMPCDDVVVFAPMSDGDFGGDLENACIRSWNMGFERNDLYKIGECMQEKALNTLVIQFNYGFFCFAELEEFINHSVDQDYVVIVMLHSTIDPASIPQNKLSNIKSALDRCDRLLVHSISDLNRLKDIGLVDNVALFPLGVLCPDLEPKSENLKFPVVANYGFCLPNKGIEQLLEAAFLLKGEGNPIYLRLINAEYPAAVSSELVTRIRHRIDELDMQDYVSFCSDFLSDDESLSLLSQADLVVYPYQATSESASASVRYGLATKKPVAVTANPIFDDILDVTFQLPGEDASSIARGITDILSALDEESEDAIRVEERASEWRRQFDYTNIGRRLYNICRALQLT